VLCFCFASLISFRLFTSLFKPPCFIIRKIYFLSSLVVDTQVSIYTSRFLGPLQSVSYLSSRRASPHSSLLTSTIPHVNQRRYNLPSREPIPVALTITIDLYLSSDLCHWEARSTVPELYSAYLGRAEIDPSPSAERSLQANQNR